MAVVQISRIQVRRGQENQGTGVPQLAGGEFGWAVDTQKLYIGNGAVSEGSPAVGNTKILTENDNFLDLAETYSYKPGEIETTVSGSEFKRTIQSRLDDRVSVRSFGIFADADITLLLQKAIYEIYLNQLNKTNAKSRIVLNVEAGEYTISQTVYLPPYVTIIGAGRDKTIFTKTGNFTMFETVDDNTVYNGDLDTVVLSGHRADPTIMDSASVSKGLLLENLTLKTTDNQGTLLMLTSTKDSIFHNVKFAGPKLAEASTSVGVDLSAKSNAVDVKQLKFTECEFVGLGFGVVTNHNVNNCVWENTIFDKLVQAFKFGEAMEIGQTAPYNNWISRCYFEDIDEHAIHINAGTRNISNNNRFGPSVGNNAGSPAEAAYSIIKFTETGNSSVDDDFDRTYNLAIDQTYVSSQPYIADVQGPVFHNYGFTQQVECPVQSTDVLLFRVSAEATKTYTIDYEYVSTQVSRNFRRSGVLTVMINRETNATFVTDDYTTTGTEVPDESLQFSANLIQHGTDTSCQVNYQNQIDQGTMTYKINVKS